MKALWQALNEAFKAISQPRSQRRWVGSFDLSLAIR
jgi:hypothetical protein